MDKDEVKERVKEMDGGSWEEGEWALWAEEARQRGAMGADELRARMRQELTEAGQEVVRVAMTLARDTYQACQDPVAWGPEPKKIADPEHPGRDGRPTTMYMSFGLTETFWKMQIPVLSVQYRLRFFAWDHAVFQAAEKQGSGEDDDDGRE